MRIAVVTANIGPIDEILPLVKQSTDYELFYYSENLLPFPLPNLDQRMKARYIKTQSHRFLHHDIIIWIDSSIDVINSDFIQTCIDKLQDNDIVITRHKQRENVYDELEYIINQMKAGNRYLLRRYAKQPFYLEYDYYKKTGLPKDFPLYNSFFFARWNSALVNEMFNDAWDLILRYSNFDQSQISFCLWKHGLSINEIDSKDLFIRQKHPGYNL